MSYDLICTGCGAILTRGMAKEATEIMEAGYCNRCPDQAKLEWRKKE